MGKYIDGNGLSHFMGILKGIHQTFVTNVAYDSSTKKITKTINGTSSDVVTLSTVATSGSYSDLSNKPTIPSANSTASNIKMDGTQSAGSLATFAKADHVHPSDTSRVPTTRKVNGKALSADIDLDASDIYFSDDPEDETIAQYINNIYTSLASKVPNTRKVNGQALSSDIILYSDDIKFEDGENTTVYDQLEAIYNLADSKEVNQNAFSNVKVGSTTVAADTKTDTLELVAGSNVTLTPDATNDKVTIASSYTDTKNTAGSTDSSSKLFIVGATSQAANPQTYSQDTAYVGTDGHLYSNSVQVVNLSGSQALTNKTYNGYTLAAACAKAVVTSVDSSASLPTSGAVKTYVDNSIGTATAGALQYKGTVDAESTITGAAYKKGWYYVVSTAGTYVGKVCEVGDMLIAKQDKTSTPANDWDAVQSNIEVLSNSEIDALWAAA